MCWRSVMLRIWVAGLVFPRRGSPRRMSPRGSLRRGCGVTATERAVRDPRPESHPAAVPREGSRSSRTAAATTAPQPRRGRAPRRPSSCSEVGGGAQQTCPTGVRLRLLASPCLHAAGVCARMPRPSRPGCSRAFVPASHAECHAVGWLRSPKDK